MAGDVCDDLGLLEDTLALLRRRFGAVFYTPGNHECWLRSGDAAPDSWTKLHTILELCRDLGVHTAPRRLDPGVWIAPLHSWHHKSFDAEPDIPGVPAASALTIADYAACRWPPGVAGPRPGDVALAAAFDALNDGPAWEQMLAERDRSTVISFSHFLPLPALLPEKRFLFFPNLAKAAGSAPLGARVAALGPDIHGFGHSHFAWDASVGGTRFLQAPLGAPAERRRRLRTLSFDALAGQGGGDPVAARWLPLEVFTFCGGVELPPEALRCGGDGGVAATARLLDNKKSSEGFRGPESPPRDTFTAAGEATHGIALPAAPSGGASGEESDDDPGQLPAAPCRSPACEAAALRQPLRHGTMPGPLGAHWSDYYAANPRTPEDTTLAPWVAHRYRRRGRRAAAPP